MEFKIELQVQDPMYGNYFFHFQIGTQSFTIVILIFFLCKNL